MDGEIQTHLPHGKEGATLHMLRLLGFPCVTWSGEISLLSTFSGQGKNKHGVL